jgi:hypothetical protein
MSQDLGSITNLETMTGVEFVAEDGNGHIVPSFNGLTLTADQASCVEFDNLVAVAATDTNPAGSTFKVDIKGKAVSTGPVTITAKGQQGNFQPVFTTPVTIEVTLDPSLPGPPTNWVVTPGTIVSHS